MQSKSMMSLLPLQGEHYRATIPRVPEPLRVTSALGYDLAGLAARCLAAQQGPFQSAYSMIECIQGLRVYVHILQNQSHFQSQILNAQPYTAKINTLTIILATRARTFETAVVAICWGGIALNLVPPP